MRIIKYIFIFILGLIIGSFFPGQSKEALVKAKDFIFSREKKEAKEEKIVLKNKQQPVVKTVSKAKVVETKRKKVVQQVQAKRKANIYTVQVASFKDLKQANDMVGKLIKDEYNAYIAPIDLEKTNGWFRVCVGESSTPEQAKQHLTNLKPQFKDSFIQAF